MRAMYREAYADDRSNQKASIVIRSKRGMLTQLIRELSAHK